MKLSLSEELLWNLYNAIDISGNFLDMLLFPPRTMYQMSVKLDNLFLSKNYKSREDFSKLIYRLKSGGHIRVNTSEGAKAVMITKNGIERVLKASFKLDNKKKRKDGKWVMLIFDMPAKYKKPRDLMRSVLQNLGYKLFQHSVWVTPYDVSEKTEKLLRYYVLEKYVKIF